MSATVIGRTVPTAVTSVSYLQFSRKAKPLISNVPAGEETPPPPAHDDLDTAE